MSAPNIVIVGAGVIGTSIAYHLARLGCTSVLVLEKEDTIGAGSTAKAAGGFRHEFTEEVNIRLSIESIRAFHRFHEEPGAPIDLRQIGYLRLVSTQEELDSCRNTMGLQQRLEVEVSLLGAQGAKDLLPALDVGEVAGATYCPWDGILDPYSVVQGYAHGARALGARIEVAKEVVGIRVQRQTVVAVQTAEEEIPATTVVNAAGPYAGRVAAMAGLNIPVLAVNKSTFYTEPSELVSKSAPYVIDLHERFGLRREGRGLGISGTNKRRQPDFDSGIDWAFLPELAQRVVKRFPQMEEVGIMRGEGGLHPDTPDGSALLGGVPGLEGFCLACGLNSQGVMHAPAIGRIVAEYLLGIGADPAISILALDRYQTGGLLREDVYDSS